LQPLVYIRMWWPAVVKSEWKLRLEYDRLPRAYVSQKLQIQLELLMMSVMPLETCWAFNERWNNKFYYKVASCWLFLLSCNCNLLTSWWTTDFSCPYTVVNSRNECFPYLLNPSFSPIFVNSMWRDAARWNVEMCLFE